MVKPTTKYLGVCKKLIDMLLANGVTPLFVIDGGDLPAKEGENAGRKECGFAVRN